MIIVVRHGQDEDNVRGILNGHRDLNLTEYGKAQMRSATTQLLHFQPDLIVTSPLKRAYTSAQIIAEYLGCTNLTVCSELIERDFGCLTGKPITDIPRYATQVLFVDGVHYFLEAEGAESFPALQVRAARVLKRLQVTYPSKKIVVVTHGDLAKMLRAAYYGWSWLRGLKTPHLKNADLIYLSEIYD
jgi:broad specificity phosphatase PhoE